MGTRAAFLLLLTLLTTGCSRAFYRLRADKETYSALHERLDNHQWDLPRTAIDPAPESRLFDPYDPDHPPLPPDDTAAHRYMHRADGRPGYRKWHKDGDAPWIESPHWRESLALNDKGQVELTPERAIELGLLHSREYQNALEDVYLTALSLTQERFQFDLQGFARNNTNFAPSGRGDNERNTLTTASNLGFNKAFTSGAQLLVEFANSWVWEFAGPNRGVTTSNIVVNLVQPLLRNGGRDFRMERLTQSERAVLYAVREFARTRKQFSVDVAVGRYLFLLLQLQNIRNQEANIASLDYSYRLHNSLFEAGAIALVDREQVFQQIQTARLALLQQQNGLETALDDYKITLGLPPNLRINLDDSLLDQFQVIDPRLTRLREDVEKFFSGVRRAEKMPPVEQLRTGFLRLQELRGRAGEAASQIREELDRWEKRMTESEEEQERAERLWKTQGIKPDTQLANVREDLDKLTKGIARELADLNEKTRATSQIALYKQTEQFKAAVTRLENLQTVIRVSLIRLRPIPFQLPEATEYALTFRLDLMNQRGRVTDAWRQITVAANALEANLDASFNANIGTLPGGTNPVDFRATASSYRVGLQFDSPLNRLAERNTYRASLVNYQRSRRSFMALDDRIQRAIRVDLRNLETERLNFEIARQSLISAVRQLQGANDRLTTAERIDPVATLNILNANAAVLGARNTLISSWVNYETGRIQLLLDMELLQLDARGFFANEHHRQPDQSDRVAPTPFATPEESGN